MKQLIADTVRLERENETLNETINRQVAPKIP
jgi:hypothetical protein